MKGNGTPEKKNGPPEKKKTTRRPAPPPLWVRKKKKERGSRARAFPFLMGGKKKKGKGAPCLVVDGRWKKEYPVLPWCR